MERCETCPVEQPPPHPPLLCEHPFRQGVEDRDNTSAKTMTRYVKHFQLVQTWQMWFFLNNLTVFESPPERRRPGQRLHLERDSPGPNPKWWRLKTCKRGLCTVVESNKFPSSVSWTELYQIVRWVPISQGHLRHPHLATALLPNLHLPTGTCKNHQKPVSKTGFFPTGFPHFVNPAVLKCNFNQFYHI